MGMLEIRDTVTLINFILVAFMTVFFAYQTFFIIVGFIAKRRRDDQKTTKIEDHKQLRYAAVSSARNEEEVIGQLIKSLQDQNYPKDLLDIYILADNCTDATAEVARKAGAIVIERFDEVDKGKGYALDYFFKHIKREVGTEYYAGYFVFDSDNIVHPDFVKEMDIAYQTNDYEAMTSYRNSKNYDDNWISAANSIYFIKEARFLNYPRSLLKTNCAISGTGFFVSQALMSKFDGWPFHLLTEDIEFSVNCAFNGYKIGYCDKAIVYDEQPTDFRQSWDQRCRWSKGFYQINKKYTGKLISGIFSRHWSSCYDLLASTAPTMLVQVACILINVTVYLYCLTKYETYFVRQTMEICSNFILSAVWNYYLLSLVTGVLTLVSEWKDIQASATNKIKYIFLFPIFVMTYVPIGIVALFKKVEWKQIKHFATDRRLVNN